MDTLQILQHYTYLGPLILAAIWVAENLLDTLGRTLWSAASGSVRGAITAAITLGSLLCAAYATPILHVQPISASATTELLAAAFGLFVLASAMTLRALIRWIDLIARIQRGEPEGSAKHVSLF